LFENVGLSSEFVPLAKTALQKHAQNNLTYDPKKAESIPDQFLGECDEILAWVGTPFSTKTSINDYIKEMKF